MSSIVALLLAGTVVSTAIKVGILVAGAKAYRASRQPSNQVTPDQAGNTTLGNRFAYWQANGRRSSSMAEAQRLQEWIQKTLPMDDEMHIWLTTLTRPAAQALTQDVKTFCATWQIELTWLFAPPLAPFAEFQARLDEIVLAYCRARWAAQQGQIANASA